MITDTLSAAVQTPPQHDSPPNSNSTVSSDESFDSPKSDETEPAIHSGGVLLLDRPDTMSPPFTYAAEGVPIRVQPGFGPYRESGFAIEHTYLRPVVERERERERLEGRPQSVKDVEIIMELPTRSLDFRYVSTIVLVVCYSLSRTRQAQSYGHSSHARKTYVLQYLFA